MNSECVHYLNPVTKVSTLASTLVSEYLTHFLFSPFSRLSGIEEDAHTTIVNGEDHIVECLGFFKFDGRELCNCTD